jgi:hypothetical protein
LAGCLSAGFAGGVAAGGVVVCAKTMLLIMSKPKLKPRILEKSNFDEIVQLMRTSLHSRPSSIQLCPLPKPVPL